MPELDLYDDFLQIKIFISLFITIFITYLGMAMGSARKRLRGTDRTEDNYLQRLINRLYRREVDSFIFHGVCIFMGSALLLGITFLLTYIVYAILFS